MSKTWFVQVRYLGEWQTIAVPYSCCAAAFNAALTEREDNGWEKRDVRIVAL